MRMSVSIGRSRILRRIGAREWGAECGLCVARALAQGKCNLIILIIRILCQVIEINQTLLLILHISSSPWTFLKTLFCEFSTSYLNFLSSIKPLLHQSITPSQPFSSKSWRLAYCDMRVFGTLKHSWDPTHGLMKRNPIPQLTHLINPSTPHSKYLKQVSHHAQHTQTPWSTLNPPQSPS